MRSQYRLADYAGLWQQRSSENISNEYQVIRSGIILGHHDEARSIIENSASLPHQMRRFLQLQIASTISNDFDTVRRQLRTLELQPNSLIIADRFMTLSYLEMRESNNYIAAAFAEKASSAYLRAGFPIQASSALYNLAVCYLNLGQFNLFHQTIEKLEETARSLKDKESHFDVIRLLAYFDMDNADYNAAAKKFHSLCQYYSTRPSSPSFGSSLATLYFLFAKQKMFNEMLNADLLYNNLLKDVLPEFQNAINAFKGVHSSQNIMDLLSLELNSNHKALLFELMADVSLELKDFDQLRTVTENARMHFRKKKLNFVSSDLQCKLALCAANEGNHREAKNLATQTLESLDASGLTNKRNHLESILNKILTKKNLSASVDRAELDLNRMIITVGRAAFELPKSQTAYKLMKALATPGLTCNLECLYELLEIQNEKNARKNALAAVNRLRAKLPRKNLISISGDVIKLNSSYKWKIINISNLSRAERQKLILKELARCETALQMADLERLTHFPRRTLQMDVKELVEQNKIKKSGSGRAVCYTA